MKLCLLLIVFLVNSCIDNKKSKTTHETIVPKFNEQEYKSFIKEITKGIISEGTINWIYHKPFIIKAEEEKKNEENPLPPLPPTPFAISKNIESNITFKEQDFEQVLILRDNSVINFKTVTNIEEKFMENRIKYGFGIIFSIPYYWSDNPKELFVDYEIVNWDLKCGTGTHFTVAYDLSNARI